MAVSQAGPWFALAALAAVLVAAPIAALVVAGAGETATSWSHLADYVLVPAVTDSVLLLAGVGVITVAVGTSAAWLVTAFDFPGRKILDWALLLPLAVPTYIIAYAYLDILHPIGPVQSLLRQMLDIANPRDLAFPDIRSMAGCVLLLGFVLYPYVYLTVRALFLMQAASLVEVARTLGAGRGGVFFRVALPLARPAIAVGASLALMEALNDIGASEFLGVRTMTVSIYTTWVTRSDLAGAARIALCMLLIVVALVLTERWSRRRLGYAAAAQRPRRMEPQALRGAAGWGALGLGSVPVVVGFVVPALYLLATAVERVRFAGLPDTLLPAIASTVTLSVAATVITVGLGLAVAYSLRAVPRAAGLLRFASLGYAVPGTVLAIGLLLPMAAFDNAVNAVTRHVFGVSVGLVMLGSGAALVYAYAARFLAMPAGGIEAGFARIPISLDHAARTLGRTPGAVLPQVHAPLLRPAITAAAILVFVDCMKELPATLLLRPLNVETLATLLYADASRGTYEDGAVAALLIVLVGIVPVVLLARLGRRSPTHLT